MSNKNQEELVTALRGLGIAPLARETRVTIARFAKLIEVIRSVQTTEERQHPLFALFPNHGTSILMQFLWERAVDKSCLYEFCNTLNEYAPTWARTISDRENWSQMKFNPVDSAEASARILSSTFDNQLDERWATAYEKTVFALADLGDMRPVLVEGKYRFEGQPKKGDCAEVVVREVLEHLMWNDRVNAFQVERLPGSSKPELVAFFQRMVKTSQTQTQMGQDWFNLCSNLEGVRYISGDPGKLYEVFPSLPNILAVLSALLGTPVTDFMALPGLFGANYAGILADLPAGRIHLTRAAHKGTCTMIMHEPHHTFVIRNCPEPQWQKATAAKWEAKWVDGTLPQHTHILFSRMFRGRLLSNIDYIPTLAHLYLCVFTASLVKPHSRLDAIDLALKWMRTERGASHKAAVLQLLSWLKQGVSKNDMSAWGLTRPDGVPDSIRRLIVAPSASSGGHVRVYRGIRGGLPED